MPDHTIQVLVSLWLRIMSSWMPSWFTFPTFDVSILPNLQRKFFSFVLKRFLGHLLKPGQLDVEQIDSAIGSGNVTINDLKLECTVSLPI